MEDTEIKKIKIRGERNEISVLVQKLWFKAFDGKHFLRLTRNIIVCISEGDNARTRGNIQFWKKGDDEIYKSIGYMDLTERNTHDTLWRIHPKPPENPDIIEASERISCVTLGKEIAMFLTD